MMIIGNLKLHEGRMQDLASFHALDAELGQFIGNRLANYLKENNLRPEYIASHGHTILHSPSQYYSVQIGHGAAIAAKTGIDCICDFRSGDIHKNGQGAPFAPIVERYLFPEYDYFLNLGGICNISAISENCTHAFDICACNQILNFAAKKLRQPYDIGGKLSAQGQIIDSLLSRFNDIEFCHISPPKSLSNEYIAEAIFSTFSKP